MYITINPLEPSKKKSKVVISNKVQYSQQLSADPFGLQFKPVVDALVLAVGALVLVSWTTEVLVLLVILRSGDSFDAFDSFFVNVNAANRRSASMTNGPTHIN
jgi:hypothetical protein